MIIIDEHEVVCKECGSIFGIDKLVFKHVDTEYAIDTNNTNIKGLDMISDNCNKLTSTYECPFCKFEMSLKDRRKTFRDLW
jgi:DNA-directed RNA polymerase subunit RPC12/RpoP